VDFGAYISLYPQLVAGPIVRYSDIDAELRERRHNISDAAEGFRRFCTGLSKKVILANTAGAMWEFFALREGFIDAYMGVFFFAMQIYFDFSGYSDMAIGLGRVFGFSFPENFNYPYISRSITDFWRRWHITLSSFFREYVYISLGGNRRGKLRTYRNLLITWALTGLWHGFSLNFLLWGLYFALILIVEKAFLGKLLARSPKLLQRCYSLLLIAIGWVIFASDGSLIGIAEGGAYILRLFGIGCSEVCSSLTLYEILRNAVFILILTLGATPLPRRIYLLIKQKTPRAFIPLNVALPLAAFVLSVAYIVNSGYNPFLYFRF
jgi:alginate O-acetyltransferase complex protein AlgI